MTASTERVGTPTFGRCRWTETTESRSRLFIRTLSNEEGIFSPDGNWMGYQSYWSGKPEIYVERFPRGSGDGVLVSANGGVQARWNPKGKELFYIGLDGRLMSVPIYFASNGKSIEPTETPTALFATHGIPLDARPRYMVSPDGHVLRDELLSGNLTSASPVTILLNWKPKHSPRTSHRVFVRQNRRKHQVSWLRSLGILISSSRHMLDFR